MAALSKIESHPSAVDCYKELPFYNKPIEKPKTKRLKNIDELAELPFLWPSEHNKNKSSV